ncbi:PqqD family protein [Mobilitalea sibirica]|uniref:PqqD family protein n=1 Tax=Mobilitalea sibirica TaxID=1462919 RepID=A0A8J7H034_9FIRM|nr:PqqD family protein [Mobilitalea sibirica]MBH1939375.1 PqqD family protein [Mobilitalea sibirica]
MRIKQGFLLREVAQSWIVVPIGQRVVEFNGLISLSESGALLWKKLEQNVDKEEELVTVLTEEYEIDAITAKQDVHDFISSLHEKGLLEQWI